MCQEWNVFCLVTKSCATLCNPMACNMPGSFVHGASQTGILEWVAIPFSSRSSQSRDQTCISYIAGGFFTTEPPGMLSICYFCVYLHKLQMMAKEAITVTWAQGGWTVKVVSSEVVLSLRNCWIRALWFIKMRKTNYNLSGWERHCPLPVSFLSQSPILSSLIIHEAATLL